MKVWFRGFWRKPARLYAVVECTCGRTVEVPEEERVRFKCGVELWWYSGGGDAKRGPWSVDKLCSKTPRSYPGTPPGAARAGDPDKARAGKSPVLLDLRFKA
jgi:hypothetical protein